MSAFWAWLLATRVGRYAAGALAIGAIVGVALLKAFAAGRAQQQASQAADKLKAISKRKTSDEKVDGLEPHVVRGELDRWLRDGER